MTVFEKAGVQKIQQSNACTPQPPHRTQIPPGRQCTTRWRRPPRRQSRCQRDSSRMMAILLSLVTKTFQQGIWCKRWMMLTLYLLQNIQVGIWSKRQRRQENMYPWRR